jgi:GH24 family phage-related lysozyme (muramidase)
MPRLADLNVDLEKQNLPTGNFSFSATRIENLGATEYTLCTIVVDISGSTEAFRSEMEKTLKEVIRACKYSPRSDNLMVRLVVFASKLEETHGFKLLTNCNESDYDGVLNRHNLGATTCLYDASVNGVEATNVYGANLRKQDFSANGLIVVITDGLNNASTYTENTVKTKLEEGVKAEDLESLLSILVGINITEQHVQAALASFASNAGFSQYVDAGKADAKNLAKLAQFISKSISSQSQSLGSGGASRPLVF